MKYTREQIDFVKHLAEISTERSCGNTDGIVCRCQCIFKEIGCTAKLAVKYKTTDRRLMFKYWLHDNDKRVQLEFDFEGQP